MEKIRAAIHVFTKSLTSVEYYQDLLKTDLKFSLKYYLVLALIFTLVTSATYSMTIIPQVEQGINRVIEYTLEAFEDDLELTLEQGTLSMNREEPYVVSFQEEVPAGPENILVIDLDGTLEDLEDTYDSLILVNEVNVLVRTEERVQVYSLSNLPDGTYGKEDLVDIVDQVRSIVRFVPYLIVTFLVLGVLFYYLVFRLIYLFLVAGLLALVGVFRGIRLEYGKYYKVAIHAMTLPMSIEVARTVFSLQFNFPYWFLLLNFLFGALVVLKLDFSGIEVGSGDNEGSGDSGDIGNNGDSGNDTFLDQDDSEGVEGDEDGEEVSSDLEDTSGEADDSSESDKSTASD